MARPAIDYGETVRRTGRLIGRHASASVPDVVRSAPGLLLAAAAMLSATNGRAEPPEVASLGPTDAAFVWRSDEPEPTRARLRAADGDGTWRIFEAEAAPSRHHVLEVDGLEPDTRYEYRLGAQEDGPGGTLTTRRPPPGDPAGVLWVLADIHLCVPEVQECPDGIRRLGAANDLYAAVLEEVRRRAATFPGELPQAIVVLGDFAQRPVAETWRVFARSATGDLPLCLVPGNHEGWEENWETHFAETVAALDDAACRYDGVRGELELGPWRIVLLSTVVPGENWGELGDEQRDWLEERLAAGPERPTLLALHHPWLPHPLSPLLGDAATYARIHDAAALEELLGRHPQVRGALSGHLHLNWAGRRGGVVQHIFSATSQFPVGFHSLTLYAEGLVRRFHPLRAGVEASAASAAALRRWAEERDLPLPGAVLGVVAGDTGARSGVQLLPESEAAAQTTGADVAGGARAGDDTGTRHDASTPPPERPAASEAPAAGGDALREGPRTSSGGGCRCALPAERGGGDVAGSLVLLASARRLRRRAKEPAKERPAKRRIA